MPNWLAHQAEIVATAERQLFLVGGAPRSGTTWVQQLLDAHPSVSCRGEGFFLAQLADKLEATMAARSAALASKNAALFRHTGGYGLPDPADTEHLVGTAILLALHRQTAGKPCHAVGEKTPENVFFYERFRKLFPTAKFIGVARDPRDVLTSAWHLFHKASPGEDEAAAKLAFLRMALPSLDAGGRTMLALADRFPADCAIVTYEGLLRDPAPAATRLFRLLGVADDPATVAACLGATAFTTATGGRPAGVEDRRAFYRKGVAGDWRTTLTPEMNALVLHELGWMFASFGWQP